MRLRVCSLRWFCKGFNKGSMHEFVKVLSGFCSMKDLQGSRKEVCKVLPKFVGFTGSVKWI